MKTSIENHTGLDNIKKAVLELVDQFVNASEPLEPQLVLLRDARTGAIYVECHIRASKLINLGTVDVP